MIQAGETIHRQIMIDDARAISFMGPDLRVYGTPSVLADMEFACRDLLLTMVDTGSDSVGLEVSLQHVGAALLGDTVDLAAVITAVDGRKISFDINITRNDRLVAKASHIRMAVSVADLKAKLGRSKS